MEQAIIVTTSHQGVFFGYGQMSAASTTTLCKARMCISWPEENHGLMGLAKDGPKKGARISPAVSRIILRDVTAIIEVSPIAIREWEAEKWQ